MTLDGQIKYDQPKYPNDGKRQYQTKNDAFSTLEENLHISQQQKFFKDSSRNKIHSLSRFF